ncbi:hypothetical protein [Lactobacillus delbrueckii]|uniref:hypothetical protein n=1 Tax=Lactobacillus delbrueckii TaxID=1584 RepID=UPI0022E965CF|nr:hypothetical protein [Lactobacillus delbrueckii]
MVKFEQNQRLDRRKYKAALNLLELLYPKGSVTTTEERKDKAEAALGLDAE